jgi:hypothetical protein
LIFGSSHCDFVSVSLSAANPSIDNVPEIKFDLTFPSTFTYNDRTGGDQEMK